MLSETKSDKIVTCIVTKYGDHSITLRLTNSSISPPKINILGKTKSDKIVTRIVTKYGDHFIPLILTNFSNIPKMFTRMGDNHAENSLENVL